jgi:hypothetical protein
VDGFGRDEGSLYGAKNSVSTAAVVMTISFLV